jgi:hypothetical protein
VIVLYYEIKKAEERQDAAVGSLTQAFKLDSIEGKQATSYQVLNFSAYHCKIVLGPAANHREHNY